MVKSERTGGTMVAIPKFWYLLEQTGSGMSIKIADKKVAGYSVSPAHMDRGDATASGTWSMLAGITVPAATRARPAAPR